MAEIQEYRDRDDVIAIEQQKPKLKQQTGRSTILFEKFLNNLENSDYESGDALAAAQRLVRHLEGKSNG